MGWWQYSNSVLALAPAADGSHAAPAFTLPPPHLGMLPELLRYCIYARYICCQCSLCYCVCFCSLLAMLSCLLLLWLESPCCRCLLCCHECFVCCQCLPSSFICCPSADRHAVSAREAAALAVFLLFPILPSLLVCCLRSPCCCSCCCCACTAISVCSDASVCYAAVLAVFPTAAYAVCPRYSEIPL